MCECSLVRVHEHVCVSACVCVCVHACLCVCACVCADMCACVGVFARLRVNVGMFRNRSNVEIVGKCLTHKYEHHLPVLDSCVWRVAPLTHRM